MHSGPPQSITVYSIKQNDGQINIVQKGAMKSGVLLGAKVAAKNSILNLMSLI
jgi:hypothetical protein